MLVDAVDCIILEEYRLWYRSNDVFYINSQSLVVLLLLAGQHRFESSPMMLTHNSPTPKRVIEYNLMTDDEKKDEVVAKLKLELAEQGEDLVEHRRKRHPEVT